MSSVGFQVSNPCDQQIDQMVERVVGVMRQRMTITGFEMGQAVKGAPEPSRNVHPLVVRQVERRKRLSDDRHDVLDGSLELRVPGARVAIGGGIQAGIDADDFAPGSADGSDSLITGHPDRRRAERFGQEFSTSEPQASQQIVEPLDMAVESRLSNAKTLGNFGESDCVESFGISENRRFIDHALGIEGSGHVFRG